MSKKKKESFKDFLKSLEAQKISEPKPVGKIEERKYFLIVCEGERTEPIYFNYLKNFLPPNLLDTIRIDGIAENTISVVKKAIAARDERKKNILKPPYDEVWAVFDKDDFPKKRYNDAISLARRNNIKSAHSNQSFELWYVLHFQYLDAALDRDGYIKALSENLGFTYAKNSLEIVRILFQKGDVKQAIVRAQKLDSLYDGNAHSDYCPQTKVHELVESLLKYSKHPALSKENN